MIELAVIAILGEIAFSSTELDKQHGSSTPTFKPVLTGTVAITDVSTQLPTAHTFASLVKNS
jgi:hypothetical protein